MKKSRLCMILLKHILPLTIGIILFIISIFNHLTVTSRNIIHIISLIFISYDIIYEAFKDLTVGDSLNENIFMLICIIGACVFKEYSLCIGICILFKIHYITQDIYKKQYNKNLINLFNFMPKSANIKINGELITQSPNDIVVGDTITISEGELIPLDGIVISGQSTVSEYKLTGNSKPRTVKIHDEVLNGSTNLESTITVKVTRDFANSTVIKTKNTILNSVSAKSKKVNVTNRILNMYITVLIFLAILYIFLPPIFNKDAQLLFYTKKAYKYMLLFAPIALITNVYISYLGIIKSLRKKGISLRNHVVLEGLNKIDTLVIDDSFIKMETQINTIEDFKNYILSDKLELIKELKGSNVSRIVILKYFPLESEAYDNDNYTSLSLTIDNLNIDIISCLPMPFIRRKILKNIMSSKSKYSNVIFFGNYINNVHLLCMSDIGVTSYINNDELALKAADIVINYSEMSTIKKLINFSKKTKKIILQNFIFCFIVKLMSLLLYLSFDFSILSMILIETLCCLPIVLNCLRLTK
ncbi:ATPase, P-type (transporting), HAD superfamily, subfamily IC [Hathewaya proteolytica DSM 3090]|uniref:ATPase, P-type (Transporting), HAD superfamily, subfamily IC n=1 Tax=Hathewaya proteolytica DSM 3090 TaxID=1121331 RepID=A0A1M6RLS9_9CLOT|nr:hypothetical protein [Hathewaya proteolytica]SHK33412.1 ATPase, P-type (transporting), HAD superfamily, subfamily IC [Hathewaya proteolytica DSM 3090]